PARARAHRGAVHSPHHPGRCDPELARRSQCSITTRRISWSLIVANGGFAQAACNIPELFEAAADGYEAIGRNAAAEVIRKAHAMSKGETGEVAKLKRRGAGIGAIFRSFRKSSLADLADELDECFRELRVTCAERVTRSQ